MLWMVPLYMCRLNIPQKNTSSKVLANEGVHYFCKWCNNTAEAIIPMIKALKERQEKIEKEIVEIHEWQDKMENELAMDKKVQSEQEKIIEEIKKQQEKVENKMEETRVNLEEWEAKVESGVVIYRKRLVTTRGVCRISTKRCRSYMHLKQMTQKSKI